MSQAPARRRSNGFVTERKNCVFGQPNWCISLMMLMMDAQDPTKDIRLFTNSPCWALSNIDRRPF
ncbi:hypothetical protein C5167_045158 [Papaver somniferum]|uniref:Uncharacterized protein n=1 Tax=Papaver somniferum TaxID=3469 RepID=A0A4Y7LA72_PAPSO|nr:hypothetical protein C5167_045158 [Papaver somniferum]